MNIVCNPVAILNPLRAKASMQKISDAGFKCIALNAEMICGRYEFRDLSIKNFKRERDYYLTENPERLLDEVQERIIKPAGDIGISVPLAMAPFASPDIKPELVDNEIIKTLAKETLKTAVKAGCRSIVVRPLTVGIDPKDLWQVNSSFYLELADMASELGSDIQILLINMAKDINGHFVRGLCAEAEEAIEWVDELNRISGKDMPRFGFCFDIGIATLCGQDLFEAITPLGERVKAAIIRDLDGINDVSMMPYTACFKGQQTGWLYMIRALRRIGFDGDLVMDFKNTYAAFPEKLKPTVLTLGRETAEFFAWHIGMERMVKSCKKRVLFGAGNMCRAYMKNYGEEYPPLFTCDNNSARWGEEFCGLTIENPEKLKDLPEDVVIILCNVYYSEITKQLEDMGIKNRIEWFNDEYMDSFHMERLKMAKDPGEKK